MVIRCTGSMTLNHLRYAVTIKGTDTANAYHPFVRKRHRSVPDSTYGTSSVKYSLTFNFGTLSVEAAKLPRSKKRIKAAANSVIHPANGMSFQIVAA